MNFTLYDIRPDPGIGKPPVPRISRKLRCRTIFRLKSVFERIVCDMRKLQRFKKGFLQVSVQIPAGHLLDDNPQDQIIHIGIDRFCAGSVKQRCFAHSPDGCLLRFLCSVISGKKYVFVPLAEFLRYGVHIWIGVPGSGREASLMTQDIPDGEGCFPLFLCLYIRRYFRSSNLFGIIIKIQGIVNKLHSKIIGDL